jgi:hypothetical protein
MAIPVISFNGVLADFREHSAVLFSDQPLPERRSKFRYPLNLTVRFRSVSRSSPRITGVGRTLNMSSGGVLVFFDHAPLYEVGAGALLEMRIDWPLLLDGRIPLQFLAHGKILRLGVSVFAAKFERYQFRTRKVSNQPENNVVEFCASKIAGA